MGADPNLRAALVRARVEGAMRAVVTGDRLPKIVLPVRGGRLVGLLRIVTGAAEVMVKDTGDEFLSDYSSDGGLAHQHFARVVARRPQDGFGRDLRLVNGRHRLRL